MEAKELQLEKKLGEARKRLKNSIEKAEKKGVDPTMSAQNPRVTDAEEDIEKKENSVKTVIAEREVRTFWKLFVPFFNFFLKKYERTESDTSVLFVNWI